MREPRAFAELETKIGQEEKPAKKPVEPYYFAEEYAETRKSKPYKSVGGYDFHIVPYHEIDRKSGNPNFSIRYNKAGEKLGGYSTGLDFDTEDKAREQIDKWEKDPGFQKSFSASDAERRKSMAGATKQGNFAFPNDPTDPDLERGYGPRIKKVMYRGDDIQQAKEAGWSDDQIIKALIDQGYDDEEAEDFVVNFDPKRFKDPKTNPARSWEAWDQEEEYARFDQELEDAYEYVYEGLPRDRQIAVFAERMDVTPEKAKAYFDSLEKRQADQKREYEANKPYRDAKVEEERKRAKEAEDKRIDGLVAKIKEARMKGDEKTAQKLVDELVFPDGLPF